MLQVSHKYICIFTGFTYSFRFDSARFFILCTPNDVNGNSTDGGPGQSNPLLFICFPSLSNMKECVHCTSILYILLLFPKPVPDFSAVKGKPYFHSLLALMVRDSMTLLSFLGQQNLIILWQLSGFWEKQEEEESQPGSVRGQGAVRDHWVWSCLSFILILFTPHKTPSSISLILYLKSKGLWRYFTFWGLAWMVFVVVFFMGCFCHHVQCQIV